MVKKQQNRYVIQQGNDFQAIFQCLKKVSSNIQLHTTTNKTVVYTCIVGNYDKLIPFYKISTDIDFICFTDDLSIRANGWKLIKIPESLKFIPTVKIQRFIKICPHLFLKNYDRSLWIDSNFAINDDLQKFFEKYQLLKTPIYINKHQHRNCIYDEATEIIHQNKDSAGTINRQVAAYQADKYPVQNGLLESGMLLRAHNDKNCIKLMEAWFMEVLKFSHRDQMSFNYCAWKLHLENAVGYMSEQYRHINYKSSTFKLIPHNYSSFNIYDQTICFVTVNFNTTLLTNALISSIKKQVHAFKYQIVVIDNSNIQPFISNHDDVIVLDNTKKQLVDDDAYIASQNCVFSKNNYASLRHSLTIDFILRTFKNKHIILLDSDVLITHDLNFLEDDCLSIYDVDRDVRMNPNAKFRTLPFIQYFNTELLRQNNLRFLDISRINGGTNLANSKMYDTGSSFYEDMLNAKQYNNKLKFKRIDIFKYIVHMKGASWRPTQNIQTFLNTNSKLYQK